MTLRSQVIIIPSMKNYNDNQYNKFVRFPSILIPKIPLIDPFSTTIFLYLLSKSYWIAEENRYKSIEASINDIANNLDISVSKVKKSLNKLKLLGIIKRETELTKIAKISFPSWSPENQVKQLGSEKPKSLVVKQPKLGSEKTKSLVSENQVIPLNGRADQSCSKPIEFLEFNRNNNRSLLLFDEKFKEEMGKTWTIYIHIDHIKRIQNIMKKYPTKDITIYHNKRTSKLLEKLLKIAPPMDDSPTAKKAREMVGQLWIHCIAKGLIDDQERPIGNFINELNKWLDTGKFTLQVDFSKTDTYLKQLEYDEKEETRKAYEKEKRNRQKQDEYEKNVALETEQRPILIAKFKEKYPSDYVKLENEVMDQVKMMFPSAFKEYQSSETQSKNKEIIDSNKVRLLSSRIKSALNQKNMDSKELLK